MDNEHKLVDRSGRDVPIIPPDKSYWYIVYSLQSHGHRSFYSEVTTIPPLKWIHKLNSTSKNTYLLRNWKKLEGDELQGKEHFLVE